MSNTYELATSLHNFAGDFYQNVFAYELSEAGAFSAWEYADKLLTQWETTVETDYMALMGSDCVLDFISAKRISGAGGPTATHIRQTGSGAATLSISTGIALDIAWITNSGTNRPGHTYITGVYDGSIVGGQWNGGFLAFADVLAADLLTQLTLAAGAGNADFGVWSRKLAQFNKAQHHVNRPKPTMLNRRTLPIL